MRPTVAMLLAWCAACGPRPDVARERTALMDADRAFAAATAAHRLEGWVAAFAEDGAMFRPGGLAEGHAAIRERMARAFADTSYSLAWAPTRADLARSGDLGYTVGRWRSRVRDAAGAVDTATGSYLTVWKKQADGTWKVVLDIGNPDEP